MSQRVDMVYAGAVRHQDAIHHAYFIVSEGGLSERATLYASPLGDFPPGAVCSFLVSRDGTTVDDADIVYKGVYDDDKAVEEWTARHGTIEASALAWSAKELPAVFSCMDPIRNAYHQVDDEQRALLLAQVVRYIVTSQ